jgi:hypothetical protein
LTGISGLGTRSLLSALTRSSTNIDFKAASHHRGSDLPKEKNYLNLFCTSALLIVLLCVPTISLSEEIYKFERMWPTLQQPWYFSDPYAVVADKDGNIYVADTYNHRIQKFTSNGQFVTKWGSYGSGDGQFYAPHGIAVDGNGDVYVVDTYNHRIQKFTSDGQFVTKWGTQGSGNGQLYTPYCITVDGRGNVYVVDHINHRVQKFTNDGQFVTKWGSVGNGDGQFNFHRGIAVDGSGNVYVTDNSNNRVQKFTSDGQFVTKWGSLGSGDGQFEEPEGIAVDSSKSVYVVDRNNHRIQKFSSSGEYVIKWGSLGNGDGQFFYPHGITVDGSGNVYVADSYNNRVQKFTSDGQFVTKWGSEGCNGISVDGSGNIYVTEGLNLIRKFTSDGIFITNWGGFGSGVGMLNYPFDLAVHPNGLVYVTESYNHRIQVFRKVDVNYKNKAIVVAGGGNYQANDLWHATQTSANFAYRTLTYQGFTKDKISYLSSSNIDLDDNGVLDDVAGDATNANLQNAITNWAKDADDVIVYLVDHGGTDSFRMNDTETLSAAKLASWLNTLQNNITGKVIIIYDACESGSFVEDLMPPPGKSRIVITSTSPGESAYFVTQGSISFSSYFWTHIFNGVNIKDAFELTKEAIKYTTAYQNPLLDANGNGIANEPEDISLVQSMYIGNGTIIYGSAPVIAAVSPAQTLTNTSSAQLYASGVTDTDGIARVWAIIRPPDYNQGAGPVQNLPSIDLMPVGSDRYEATYIGFSSAGTYLIAIYALDRLGNTSIPKVTQVSISNPLSRKAIIVAGGTQTDDLWPAIEKNAGLAYDALKFQGYTDDDIYFMSPVTFSVGIDGTSTLSNLQYAITTWAASNTQDLVIYLIGNGGNGTFQISSTETLAVSALKTWLDSLQTTLPGKVIVVYDAPQSGSFLSALAPPPPGKQRIVLASAGNNQSSYYLSGGDISFSRFFWSRVTNGMNVRDAFLHSKRAMGFLSSNRQEPTIDDNGNGTGNEKSDGSLAMNTSIGFGITLGADDPLIGSVSAPQTLSGGAATAAIWAKDVTTTGTIDKAWAVINTPSISAGAPSTPVTDLPHVDLIYNGTTYRYEGSYNGFTLFGLYDVAVFAMDTEGNISEPRTTTVFVATTTVEVNPGPGAMNTTAPWMLTGPNGYNQLGTGVLIIYDLTPGDYTLTWGDVSGWTKPSPVSSKQTLAAGSAITFTGIYSLIVGPMIQVTQSILTFGYVPPGSYKDLVLWVKNIGTGTLTGTVSACPPFTIISGGTYSLGAGVSQQVIIRYTAPLQEGSQTCSLSFSGGGGITIQVKGTNKKAGLPWLMLLLD